MNVEAAIKAEKLIIAYEKVRAFSEEICKPLGIEDYVVQPIVDVSPPKWHLAHTTWFFETFLLVPLFPGYRLFDEQYSFLFNSYYISAGDRWVRADRGNLTRPSVAEIYAYRKYVDQKIVALFQDENVKWDQKLQHLFDVGINHEQQHQELLLYDIKYILGNNPLLPAYLAKEHVSSQGVEDSQAASWLEIPSGNYQIGWADEGFSFDNEHEVHTVYLENVSIRELMVTNEEYVQFIEEGGYDDHSCWLAEGWDWVQKLEHCVPMYWHKIEGSYYRYSLFGIIPLEMNEPVMHVSYYEADAFARWKGNRLPTENEWEIACRMHSSSIPEDSVFADDLSLGPAMGKGHFYGSLWEWTSSAYRPYPGYRVPEGTIGEYNGKFMMNQMVLRGGSFGTSRDHIRYSYRNFFHPHLRWMFSGFRLAQSNL